ncbi:MAG: hypothetical protein AAFY81_06120 [Pseudomonadota bacterium]
MTLIAPQTISFRAEVSEEEIKERLAMEVLESIGALGVDGKPHPHVKWRVLRGSGRKGGYCIEVTGPAPAKLSLPPVKA